VLKDLRDSGSLEQDGDLIILLHRPDYYRYAEPGYVKTQQLEAIVAKNKDGGPVVIPLHFDGAHQRISGWDGGQATQPEEDPF
jgi:replicative DNA helicase